MKSFIFYICSMNRNAMRWWSSWRWSNKARRRLDRTCSVTYKKWVTFKNNFRYYLLLRLSIYFTFIRFDSFTFELQVFYKNKIFFFAMYVCKILVKFTSWYNHFYEQRDSFRICKKITRNCNCLVQKLHASSDIAKTLQFYKNFTRILHSIKSTVSHLFCVKLFNCSITRRIVYH